MAKQPAKLIDPTLTGNWIIHAPDGTIRMTITGPYEAATLNVQEGEAITPGEAHPERHRIKGGKVVDKPAPPPVPEPVLSAVDNRRLGYAEIGLVRQIEALLDADRGDRTKLDGIQAEIASIKARFPK